MVAKACIPRSGAFAWSPVSTQLAVGTLAGALDESFSNESKLEVWDPFPGQGEPAVLGSVNCSVRFSKLAWGHVKLPERPSGVLAAGMEDGGLCVWDPTKIVASAEDALMFKTEQHTGPVRSLDFNATQSHVLATGATNGEIWVWDLNTPQKPYSPGTRSRNLQDISSLAWNKQVAHILATSSTSGYTVVWDLRNKREVVALNFAAATGQQPGGPATWMNGQQGARRGISAVSWHPDNPTKIATASEDDMSPVVMVWDLRNPRAPEKTLTGHQSGILGMDWCPTDPDLLISCGKDSRSICWNPSTGESVGELSRSTNWAFEARWCPRLPDVVAVSSFDGKIDLHPLQSTRSEAELQAEVPSGADIFEQGNLNVQSYPAVSLSQAPKWLRRPISACFGFGGKLISLHQQAGGHPAVKIHQVVTESKLVERALKLEHATEEKALATFATERIAQLKSDKEANVSSWQLLAALFRADSRDELVTLLGFSKEDVKSKVDEAIRSFKERASLARSPSDNRLASGNSDMDDTGSLAREPLVTFAEHSTAMDAGSASSGEGEAAAASSRAEPSEASVSGYSESTKQGASTESEVTEPSLWGDDLNLVLPAVTNPPGTTATQAAADFYNSIGHGRPAALPDHLFQTGEQSSVAATIGSRPSSVASIDQIKSSNTFKIYPAEESDAERLITRALILGDFASAVSLCMSAERFADALLLAVRGGPELLASTQQAYFQKQTKDLPYLRVFQSIVSDDLIDVVQNADISEWQEIFVVLCTFAKKAEFASLVEQLGQRLEFQSTLSKGRETTVSSDSLRKNAVLCYLAAGKLEKVVGIWSEEMAEEESADSGAPYSAHANALQGFIEKVAIFQAATDYKDAELSQPTQSSAVADSGARTYKLALLYDRYCEYAELLAAQGLVTLALRYASLVPSDYGGTHTRTSSVKDRLVHLTGKKAQAPVAQAKKAMPVMTPARSAAMPPANSFGAQPQSFGAPFGAQPSNQQSSFSPAPLPPVQSGPYAPAQPVQNTTFAQTAQSQQHNPYGPPPQQSQPQPSMPFGQVPPNSSFQPASYNQMPAPPQPTTSFAPPPPSSLGYGPPTGAQQQQTSAPPPPAFVKRTTDQGWNDAPAVLPPPKRSGSAMAQRNPIASPFPNSSPTGPQTNQQQMFAPPPPPSRGATPANAGPRSPPPPSRILSPPPPTRRAGSTAPPTRSATGGYGPSPAAAQVAPPNPPSFGPSGPQPNYGIQQPMSQPQQQPGSQFSAPPASQYAPAAGAPPSQYGPPPGSSMRGAPPMAPGPPRSGMPGPPGTAPPQQSFAQPPPAQPTSPKVAQKPEPPKPKYPQGDRNHIPDEHRIIFEVLSQRLTMIRQNTPPQQKKMVDDTERRLNVLFDGLNCETLTKATTDALLEVIQAVEAHNSEQALDLHLRLLTSGAPTSDQLTGYMPALKVICRFA